MINNWDRHNFLIGADKIKKLTECKEELKEIDIKIKSEKTIKQKEMLSKMQERINEELAKIKSSKDDMEFLEELGVDVVRIHTESALDKNRNGQKCKGGIEFLVIHKMFNKIILHASKPTNNITIKYR